jgi:3-phosphoshikimate 1-carboxyvinyltransferase
MFVNPLKPFSAKVRLPGDKSISHRLVLTSLLLSGNIEITNLSACQDLLTSLEIVQKLGIHIEKRGEDDFLISAPQKKIPTKINTLNCGNSGTTARLLCGILAGQNGKFDLYGDDSLSKRPMKRVLSPLLMMKANIKNTEGTDHLPISIIGSKHLQSIDFSLPVSSAQLKSAIIYAGIQAQGTTKIIEPVK